MRDARRIHERVEVRLERMQLIWLTLGMVVALGVVFALGVVVGRRAARLEPTAPLPDPIAQLDEDGELHQELTFYTRLTEPEAEARALPPAPREPTVLAAPGPETPGPTVRAADKPSTPPGEAPAQAPAVGPAEDEVKAALARGPARAGEYTVQVSSFQTAEEARAYAGSLERKGYRPFVVAAEITGRGTWYRVRLGSFEDEESARSAKLLLARSDIPAWVLRTE